MNLPLTLLAASMLLYFAAFLCHLLSFYGSRGEAHPLASTLMRVGFLVSTFYFFEQAVESGHILPVYRPSDAMAFFAWALAFVYLVLFVRIQRESFGLILTPVLVLFTAAACFFVRVQPEPVPAFSDAFFTLHVITAFFAYACFTVSFAAGVLYLVQQHELKSKRAGTYYHKLPSLEALEKLIFQPMAWGSLLLLAAVSIGSVWSRSEFGTFFLVDAKTIATALTVVFYAGILYVHYGAARRGKRVIVASIFAFGMVIFSFVGARFIGGTHPVAAAGLQSSHVLPVSPAAEPQA